MLIAYITAVLGLPWCLFVIGCFPALLPLGTLSIWNWIACHWISLKLWFFIDHVCRFASLLVQRSLTEASSDFWALESNGASTLHPHWGFHSCFMNILHGSPAAFFRIHLLTLDLLLLEHGTILKWPFSSLSESLFVIPVNRILGLPLILIAT